MMIDNMGRAHGLADWHIGNSLQLDSHVWLPTSELALMGLDNACQIWCNVVCTKLKLWMVFDKLLWAQSNRY